MGGSRGSAASSADLLPTAEASSQPTPADEATSQPASGDLTSQPASAQPASPAAAEEAANAPPVEAPRQETTAELCTADADAARSQSAAGDPLSAAFQSAEAQPASHAVALPAANGEGDGTAAADNGRNVRPQPAAIPASSMACTPADKELRDESAAAVQQPEPQVAQRTTAADPTDRRAARKPAAPGSNGHGGGAGAKTDVRASVQLKQCGSRPWR